MKCEQPEYDSVYVMVRTAPEVSGADGPYTGYAVHSHEIVTFRWGGLGCPRPGDRVYVPRERVESRRADMERA